MSACRDACDAGEASPDLDIGVMLILMDEIRASVARLRGSCFRFTYEQDVPGMVGPARRLRGPLTRLYERFLRAFSHQECEGVADFAGRRSMRDLGHYAVLRLGDEEWSGRSGRALSTLPAGVPNADQPLWLVEALAGAVDARTAFLGDLVVTVDLEAVDFWNTPPSAAVTNKVELEVLLDAGAALQRIWWSDGTTTQLLTVLEVDVDAEAHDWTRLPTFRTADG